MSGVKGDHRKKVEQDLHRRIIRIYFVECVDDPHVIARRLGCGTNQVRRVVKFEKKRRKAR